jgi:hypothetical protein
VIANTNFTIAAGARAAIPIKLSKTATALLAKNHHLTVTARIVTHNTTGTQASTTKTLTLTQPAKTKTSSKHH